MMQYAKKMALGYKHSKPSIHMMTPVLIHQTFASEPSVRDILSVVPKLASCIRKYLKLGEPVRSQYLWLCVFPSILM